MRTFATANLTERTLHASLHLAFLVHLLGCFNQTIPLTMAELLLPWQAGSAKRLTGSMAKLLITAPPNGLRGKLLKMTFKQVFLFLATLVTFSFNNSLFAQQAHGKASFYGNRMHGRRTSDGSTYHKDSLTCAHRTLPFGTLLKVTNKNNGKEVVVRVTDRGPFHSGRVVDLSMAAARELGMVNQGVAFVKVEPVGFKGDTNFDNDTKNSLAALPQPKYIDPATGKFYSMDEWKQRGEKIRQQHLAELQKKQQPRYRILNTKLTAKNMMPAATKKK